MAQLSSRHVKMAKPVFSSGHYADGTPALMVRDAASGDREVLSVNLAAYDAYPPAGHVFVRAYGKHEGVAEELMRLGVAEKVTEVGIGHSYGYLMKLNEGSGLFE